MPQTGPARLGTSDVAFQSIIHHTVHGRRLFEPLRMFGSLFGSPPSALCPTGRIHVKPQKDLPICPISPSIVPYNIDPDPSRSQPGSSVAADVSSKALRMHTCSPDPQELAGPDGQVIRRHGPVLRSLRACICRTVERLRRTGHQKVQAGSPAAVPGAVVRI